MTVLRAGNVWRQVVNIRLTLYQPPPIVMVITMAAHEFPENREIIWLSPHCSQNSTSTDFVEKHINLNNKKHPYLNIHLFVNHFVTLDFGKCYKTTCHYFHTGFVGCFANTFLSLFNFLIFLLLNFSRLNPMISPWYDKKRHKKEVFRSKEPLQSRPTCWKLSLRWLWSSGWQNSRISFPSKSYKTG